MPISIIRASRNTKYVFPKNENYLHISEFYYDAVQGEGASIGTPSAFLRMQGCSLYCQYCDTKEVLGYGRSYSFEEVFTLMEKTTVIQQFKKGQHLVLTGGSPLLRQKELLKFLREFEYRYGFLPYIEIENECVYVPEEGIALLISQWNNSPKLENSGMTKMARYRPDVLKLLSQFPNSWFKFVITQKNDWEEIEKYYLEPSLIRQEQIILMPECLTTKGLIAREKEVLDLAMRKGVRYSDRLHIRFWGNKIGF